ncbi:MAG: ABC transporter ATP-binding protein [Actinomycetota bacterium]
MSPPTVTAFEVGKRFGRTVALDEVSVSFARGATGVIGPNGSGKSTLLRCVATVMPPDAGRIRVGGLDPSEPGDQVAIRRLLGYLPQDPGLPRRMRAFDFVDYVAVLKEMHDQRARHYEVRRALDRVNLDGAARAKVKALSGGMRHRLALAQAFLGEPELLVLDEPATGLDPHQRKRLTDTLASLAPDATVVLSTHLPDDVSACCDHVVVLDHGRVVYDGTPESLTATAAERVWLADTRPSLARVSWAVAGGRYRCAGDPPPGAEVVEPTLEDAYLLLVGDAPGARGA